MKALCKVVVLSALAGFCGSTSAQMPTHLLSSGADWCFGTAMVGFDSVINSRLGLPAEHALDMTFVNRSPLLPINDKSTHLLTVILDAYLWEGAPHDYAVNVFYSCAIEQAPIVGATK